MRHDVVDLRDFYRSSLGMVARRMIGRAVRERWPDVGGRRLLGLGYATPFLRAWREEAERVVAVMPPTQGILHWPPDGANLAVLADETDLPLPDLSVDRILAVHALEHCGNLRGLLREIWRVMAGDGRVLFVVPNRRGIWARIDSTPFGAGYPYSASQLTRLLRDNMFTPISTAHALCVPPTRSRPLLASAGAWENIGQRWFPAFAGVVLVEAEKQLYAATPAPARRRLRVAAPALDATLGAGPRPLPSGRGDPRFSLISRNPETITRRLPESESRDDRQRQIPRRGAP